MKKILFLGLFIFSATLIAQNSLDKYKYVIVANKLDFFKKVDQYQTSSLTKFLFNKYGYKAFLSIDNLPENLKKDRCLALYASINNESSMITTRLNIILKDCNENVIFTSALGKSKEKEYQKTYHEAIRNAFSDTVIQNYKYSPQAIIAVEKKPTTIKNEIQIVETQPIPKKGTQTIPVINSIKSIQLETPSNVLYAQANELGFQLVDTTPKVLFILLNTFSDNVFIIKDKNGLLRKSESIWIAEYYENGKLIQKEYQIKF